MRYICLCYADNAIRIEHIMQRTVTQITILGQSDHAMDISIEFISRNWFRKHIHTCIVEEQCNHNDKQKQTSDIFLKIWVFKTFSHSNKHFPTMQNAYTYLLILKITKTGQSNYEIVITVKFTLKNQSWTYIIHPYSVITIEIQYT